MKKLLTAALVMLSLHTLAQDNDRTYDADSRANYRVSRYEANDDVTYPGKIPFAEMSKMGQFGWVRDGAEEYTPNVAKINYLKKNLEPYEIIVFMGLWNHDSHVLVPALYKVLQEANYWGDYTMYSVDKGMQTKGSEGRQYHITQVPVIILVRDNREVGRITRKVNYSLEDDLVNMIERDRSQHPY